MQDDSERIARLETKTQRIEEIQEEQGEKLDEILAGIHRLNGFKEFREEHDEMWKSHQRSKSMREYAWEAAKVISGGGVLALVVQMVM